MKTKEEVIKKAWNISTYLGSVIDENGWLSDKYLTNKQCVEFNTNSDLEYNIELGYRPKSLQGIENNNGWIRIESESDLPKTQSISEEIHCFIKSSDNETIGMGKFSFGSFKTFFGNNYENITHYQPIVKPNKPLY